MNLYRLLKKGSLVGLSGTSKQEKFRQLLAVRRQAEEAYQKAREEAINKRSAEYTDRVRREREEHYNAGKRAGVPAAGQAEARGALGDESRQRSALLSAVAPPSAEEQRAREEGGSLFFFSSMVQVLEDSFSFAPVEV